MGIDRIRGAPTRERIKAENCKSSFDSVAREIPFHIPSPEDFLSYKNGSSCNEKLYRGLILPIHYKFDYRITDLVIVLISI